MTHIIDREEIVLQLLKGQGRAVTGPFYINGPQCDRTIEAWSYDPTEAARLLTEAGWVDTDNDGVRDKNGRPFRFGLMYASDNVLYRRLCKYVKGEAAKVGIEVNAQPLEWSVLIGLVSDRQFEAVLMGRAGDILEDPYRVWHCSQTGSGGCNFVGFSNPQADTIIELARRTLDDGARNKLYHELHRILHEQQPYTFLFTRPSFRLIDGRFENVKVYNLGLKYWQWYVPEEKQRYR